MKFIMTQTELERAVQQYVRKLIPGLDANSVIEPEFKATRGADGFTAEVDILSPEDLAEVAATKAAVPEAQPTSAKAVAAPKAAPVQQPAPVQVPEPVAEVVEEPLSQSTEDKSLVTEESQQAEPVQEEAAHAPATATTSTSKRPLFGIRQPS